MRALPSFKSLSLIVVSNRGPVEYHLEPDGRTLEMRRASGGLVTALSALRRYQEFVWVASAMTAGDRYMASSPALRLDRPLRYPPSALLEKSRCGALDFVVVPEDVFRQFYEVFSNRILWFLQHTMWDQLLEDVSDKTIGEAWWTGYVPTNLAFARSVESRALGYKTPIVMFHDYHLYLAPAHVRKRLPNAVLQHFVHIPWPKPDSWRVLPRSIVSEICRGLLANDIVGFQTRLSAYNFLATCRDLLDDAEVDDERWLVRFRERNVAVRAYPISVDVAELLRTMGSPEVRRYQRRLRKLCGKSTIVRVDRLDPSKNIIRGFLAFERLLRERSDLQGMVKFLAFLVPSRTRIAEYQRYYEQVIALVSRINTEFGDDGYRPIELFYENNYYQALAGMSLCDVLLVNPIADGMNLVAKEGPIVSRRDSALILSRTAGAFEELKEGAIGVDPENVDEMAAALATALSMPLSERRARARAMRSRIEEADLSRWMAMQMDDLLHVLAERSNDIKHPKLAYKGN